MSNQHGEIHHEETEPQSYGIGLSAAITVITVVGSILWSYFYFQGTVTAEKNEKEQTPVSLEVQKLRVYEEEELHNLHWVNKETKHVKISIDMAMRDVVSSYSTH